MVAEIGAALSSLKAAYEITKGLTSVRDAAMVQGKVTELLGKIFAAQEGALGAQAREFALSKRVSELEQQIGQMEAWDREQERYQLTELPPGVFVYAVKEEARGAEPPHKLCAHCFQQRKKSILHSSETRMGITRMHCPSCEAEIKAGRFQEPRVIDSGGSWAD